MLKSKISIRGISAAADRIVHESGAEFNTTKVTVINVQQQEIDQRIRSDINQPPKAEITANELKN